MANDSLPQRVVSRMAAIREFGNTEAIARLTTEILPNDDYLGWELAAVTARLLGARGAYRCPGEDGFLYVVYTDIRFAQEATLNQRTAVTTLRSSNAEHMVPHDQPRFANICSSILSKSGFLKSRARTILGPTLGAPSAT